MPYNVNECCQKYFGSDSRLLYDSNFAGLVVHTKCFCPIETLMDLFTGNKVLRIFSYYHSLGYVKLENFILEVSA